MPIEILCSGCGKKLRAPDSVAGKKFRCPSCQTLQQISASAVRVAPAPVAVFPTVATPQLKAEMWQIKLAAGHLYGPVTKDELDTWVAESRVTADCHLLRIGDAEWQWAYAVYPELATPPSVPAYAAAPAAPSFVINPTTPSFAVNPAAGHSSTKIGQNRKSDKSRVVAALLAFMFSGFGAHRFYLGYPGIGLCIILATVFTLGIGGLWSWFEGFMLLTGAMDRDADGRLLQ